MKDFAIFCLGMIGIIAYGIFCIRAEIHASRRESRQVDALCDFYFEMGKLEASHDQEESARA